MEQTPIVVASNRGPVALVRASDGSIEQRRGVGGLVTAVGGAVRGCDTTWIAAAITEVDREEAFEGRGSFEVNLHPSAAEQRAVHVRLTAIDPPMYDLYYNEFSNRTLWFLHHDLWETPHAPAFGAGEAAAWDAFRDVNARFAAAVADAAPADAYALPQDYHLSLVPLMLRELRPELPQAFFWHIPFCSPDNYRVLPDTWGAALLEGMLGADVVGFHTQRWARNFIECCREVLGARVRGKKLEHGGRLTRVAVHPIGVDTGSLAHEAADPAVARAGEHIDAMMAGRTMILRVDRTELSKNILRGFIAYDMLLERRPDLHGRIVHVAMLTPSRGGVPEYEEYLQQCKMRAAAINERYGSDEWVPLIVEIEDDFPSTLAAYQRYEVLVVNPVYDGMNLVAREGPLLNQRDGVLVLSRNAGAAAELAPAALIVNPFDPAGTADAIEQALALDADQRRTMAEQLRALARGTSPERWLRAQLKDLSRPRGA